MKIKIMKEGKEVELKLALKGRHTKKIIKHFTSVMNATEDNNGALIAGYFDLLDKIGQEASGFTEEQLDDLDAEEKNKIINTIQDAALSSISFLKSSLKSES